MCADRVNAGRFVREGGVTVLLVMVEVERVGVGVGRLREDVERGNVGWGGGGGGGGDESVETLCPHKDGSALRTGAAYRL